MKLLFLLTGTPKTATCLGCDLPFSEVEPHTIPTTPGRGMCPWCVWCNGTLNLGTKKSLVSILVNCWRDGLLEMDYDAVEDAAHRVIEREYGIM